MSCVCDVCGCETPSLTYGGVDAKGHALPGSRGRCKSCLDKAIAGEIEKHCATCLHQCMEPDSDFYCAAVNKPYGQVLTRPRHKDCAGESGDEYLLWERDTRGHRGGG